MAKCTVRPAEGLGSSAALPAYADSNGFLDLHVPPVAEPETRVELAIDAERERDRLRHSLELRVSREPSADMPGPPRLPSDGGHGPAESGCPRCRWTSRCASRIKRSSNAGIRPVQIRVWRHPRSTPGGDTSRRHPRSSSRHRCLDRISRTGIEPPSPTRRRARQTGAAMSCAVVPGHTTG